MDGNCWDRGIGRDEKRYGRDVSRGGSGREDCEGIAGMGSGVVHSSENPADDDDSEDFPFGGLTES